MEDKKNFLLSAVITLSTILIGLVSYIVYSEYQKVNRVPSRCPYSGWEYEHGESFLTNDNSEFCLCNDGTIACTDLDLILDNETNGEEN